MTRILSIWTYLTLDWTIDTVYGSRSTSSVAMRYCIDSLNPYLGWTSSYASARWSKRPKMEDKFQSCDEYQPQNTASPNPKLSHYIKFPQQAHIEPLEHSADTCTHDGEEAGNAANRW